VDILERNFKEIGYSVKINTPFSGSIVPLGFYKKEKKVISVMIEVNRKLYMNEETFKNQNISL
jgi:N-formylglutamate amidohydrolase